MSAKLFFTPGPTGMFPTVNQHVAKAFETDVVAISHRSKKYEAIHKETVENLRQLLGLPSDYHIFFTGSATEIWDRIIENCVEDSSFHCVNGSFSKRFYETAKELGRSAKSIETEFGKGFYAQNLPENINADLICLTHNETSSGVSMPELEISRVKDNNPNAILAVDAVSSMPFPSFDYQKVDTVLFSVQKGFGMPAGLGVWLVNEKCIEKAKNIVSKGKSIGSYHNLLSLHSKAIANQTPETPNVLGIYLLGKVAGDMLNIGIDSIREQTILKASKLYDFLSNHPNFEVFVSNKDWQSQTVVVANTKIPSPEVNKFLEQYNMTVGTGYAKYKEQQIRIANFPGVSLEQVEALIYNLSRI